MCLTATSIYCFKYMSACILCAYVHMGFLAGLYQATYRSSDFGKGSILLLCDIMSELLVLVEGKKGRDA